MGKTWNDEIEGKEKKSTSVNKGMDISQMDINDIFKPAIDIPTVKCLRCGVFAPAKSGKTHWALTAKRPIYFLDTEKSANILVKQLPEEIQKEIFIVDLVDFAERKGEHIDLVQSMEVTFDIIGKLIDMVEKSEKTGSLVIDSCSDLWEALKIWLSEQENLKTVKSTGEMMGVEWGRANKRWTQLMRLLQASDWNVILTFKAKERFGSKGERLGIFDADWQKNTFHFLDLNIEIQRIGSDHTFIFHGGRFGDSYKDLTNPTFDDVREYLTEKSGVKFE